MVIDDLETPAVVIDLDIMERNIRTIQEYCDTHGFDFRPHIKTHKIPEIAHMQLRAGAVGITCQKLGEAEVMAAAGISDILIYYNIIGLAKLERLTQLARRVNLSVVIDSEYVLEGLAEAVRQADVEVGVFVDCDGGLHRTGVPTLEGALALAQSIHSKPNLQFKGLSMYPLTEDTRWWIEAAIQLFKERGVNLPSVSVGSTKSPQLAHTVPGITALVAGTYVFYDWSSVKTGVTSLENCAARVLATVASAPTEGRVTVDAGSKTLTSDSGYLPPNSGYGHVVGYPDATIFSLSEEHGQIAFQSSQLTPKVGDRISIIPNHVCAMINQHDVVYGVRGNRVDVVWSVAARGKVR